jgi:hypothetical protein
MWWIKLKDKEAYEDLMRKYGTEPRILRDDGDYIQVEFSQAALTTWIQAGYWFGGPPNIFVRTYKKCLTFFKNLL